MKSLLAFTAALAAVATAVPADATLLHYELTGTTFFGAVEYAEFTIDSNRVPDDYSIGEGFAFFALPGTYTYAHSTIHMDDMYFYNADQDGGIYGQSGITATDGPQLYTGPESAPHLLTGTFTLTDHFSHDPLTLTVTAMAVPEPISWAMTAGGFAMMGAAMRGRRGKALAA